MKYNADDLMKDWPRREIRFGERWVLARPEGAGWLDRLFSAWLVLRGKADALTWTDQ